MKKILPIILLLFVMWFRFAPNAGVSTRPSPASAQQPAGAGDAAIAEDFQQHRMNVRVEGSGVVVKVLRDDTEGLQHQKFLLRLGSGQTLLVAHDISIAQRVEGLKKGDTVEFNGEYVWTEQGGVVHWTHHDPEGRHAAGWLKHDGRIFQ